MPAAAGAAAFRLRHGVARPHAFRRLFGFRLGGRRGHFAALVRRHGEHRCAQHGHHHADTAGEVERHRKIGYALAHPIHGHGGGGVVLPQIHQSGTGRILIGCLQRDGTRIARHGGPHVRIGERHIALAGQIRPLGLGVGHRQCGPLAQSGHTDVGVAGNPAGDVLHRSLGHAHRGLGILAFHRHRHPVIDQPQHAGIGDYIARARDRSRGDNLTTGLPGRGVQHTEYNAGHGDQPEDGRDHTPHDLGMTGRTGRGLRLFLFTFFNSHNNAILPSAHNPLLGKNWKSG